MITILYVVFIVHVALVITAFVAVGRTVFTFYRNDVPAADYWRSLALEIAFICAFPSLVLFVAIYAKRGGSFL